MRDVLFALLAIAAGALFYFAGFVAFRLVTPLWGAFDGFSVRGLTRSMRETWDAGARSAAPAPAER